MDTGEIVALIIVGALAGTTAASMLKFSSSGQSKTGRVLRDTVIGITGALVGGFVFAALDLDEDIPEVLNGAITLADIIVAIVGAIIVIVGIRFVNR